ncbi:MAG TPA: XdhC family protein [Kofleriaceae bacterium]
MIERAILEASRRLRERGEPFVIATVVRVRGSAYRRPGARMIITCDGWIAGSVSGGCLEGDLARRAFWLTEHGATLVSYDSNVAPDAEPDEVRAAFGLGCGGVIDILVERHDRLSGNSGRLDPIALADEWMGAQRRGAIATRIAGGSLFRCALADDGEPSGNVMFELSRELAHAIATGETHIHAHHGHDYLIEAIRPSPRLFVFGTGHDVVPVVALGRRLGWEVIVCARHARHGIVERFSDAGVLAIGTLETFAAQIDSSDRALALVMSHDLDVDRANLGMLLGTRAMYIGVLGPRSRTDRMLGELGGVRDPRIHGPVGLELGAETPDEIALSIVSEIQAVLARSPATHLREHLGSIHASASS